MLQVIKNIQLVPKNGATYGWQKRGGRKKSAGPKKLRRGWEIKKTPPGKRKNAPGGEKIWGWVNGGCGGKLSPEVYSFRDGDLWSSSQGKAVDKITLR